MLEVTAVPIGEPGFRNAPLVSEVPGNAAT